MLRFIDQDILRVDAGLICHQTNCAGVMGSGLALQIKTKYPEVYEAYSRFCAGYKTLNTSPLGLVYTVRITPELVIANLFGQYGYGTDKQYTDYVSVELAFAELAKLLKYEFVKGPIYVPYRMGCGFGGGNWETYSAIIEKHVPDAIVCKL